MWHSLFGTFFDGTYFVGTFFVGSFFDRSFFFGTFFIGTFFGGKFFIVLDNNLLGISFRRQSSSSYYSLTVKFSAGAKVFFESGQFFQMKIFLFEFFSRNIIRKKFLLRRNAQRKWKIQREKNRWNVFHCIKFEIFMNFLVDRYSDISAFLKNVLY
jgi:hypothetical protein